MSISLRSIASKLPPSAKQALKTAARQTIGRLPPPSHRLTGRLVKEGGTPVRDVRFRPWPSYFSNNVKLWSGGLGRDIRRLFLAGAEGLPQTLIQEFAQKWADYCGVRHALVLPHGTDALRLALAATLDHDGLTHGGEVIVPNLSFVASANAALDRRFGVVLVDVDPQTLSIDPQCVEEAIIPGKTRAIMPVHLFGQPADMAALQTIARKHGLKIIEDAAQAHGAIHELGRAGSLGDAAGFSFQSFKNLSSGEGGALTTNDPAIFERAWQLHNVGRTRIGGQRWGHETLGWNCRATEYVAAVLLHRLRLLEAQQAHRYANYMLLRELLEDMPCVEMLGVSPGVIRHGVHMAAMRYRPAECGGLEIDDFVSAIQAEGFPGARAYSCTISLQPAYMKLAVKHPDYVRVMPTPVADQATHETIVVDQNAFLGTTSDIEEIAAIFRKVQRHHGLGACHNGPCPAGRVQGPEAKVLSPKSGASGVIGRAANAAGAKRVRCGIIGFGVMGQSHAAALREHPSFVVATVADPRPEALAVAGKLGAKCFSSPEALITNKDTDLIIIATPHWQHAELAIAGFGAGLHVICEKPLAVTVAQADSILEAAERSKRLFAAVHQTRFDPAFRYAKELLENGELGPIYRCSIVETMWRTNSYYRSSPWRATWKGEGGGVLLNQAPHTLDRYAWLCGMPESVWAQCDTALHPIEVEDTASAMFHHPTGAHGFLHVSTNECPGISQTTISCDRGRIQIDNGRLRIVKLSRSIREATANDNRHWGELASETREIAASPSDQLLSDFYSNLAQALNGSTALVCPGPSARDAVELANAFLLSTHTGTPVKLPLDRAAYEAFMAGKLAKAS